MSYDATEGDRRLANVVQIGTIKALDEAQGLVQVDLGGPTTDWIPWTQARAGGDRTWSAPEVGEQVVIVAPSGELGNAVVIGSIPQDAHPAAGNSKDVARTIYGDGTVVEYDRAAHQLKIDVSAASGTVLIVGTTVTVQCTQATVQAATSVTLDTPNTFCTGNLAVAKSLTMGSEGGSATFQGSLEITGPSLTHNGKNVGSTHTHSGIQPGGGSTAAPN